MAEVDALYRMIGDRIRTIRERSTQKLSQAKLAKLLGMSRASIVNIESGRQRAPVHLLWRIADALETELAMLIPRRAELETAPAMNLNETMRDQIKLEANGNPELEKSLTNVVGRLLGSIETPKKKGTK